jgi:hypothetical protein
LTVQVKTLESQVEIDQQLINQISSLLNPSFTFTHVQLKFLYELDKKVLHYCILLSMKFQHYV